MIASSPPGPGAWLAGADTWASIAYGVDGPSLEFVRPPFNLDLPLTDAELVSMADGIFPAHVEAAIAAATMPPSRPLTEADWATLAGIARAALRAPSPGAPQADAAPGPASVPTTVEPPSPRDEGNRDFKVIVEFAARGAGSRQVIISVGGTGRSESFRRCDVDDWRDALVAEAPQVVEAFFARCRERPVYPAYRPAAAVGAASGTKSGTGAPQERPSRRGKGGGATTSPLLVFTPAPSAQDPGAVLQADADAAPMSVSATGDSGSAVSGSAANGAPQPPDDPAKPMRQQLSFLFG